MLARGEKIESRLFFEKFEKGSGKQPIKPKNLAGKYLQNSFVVATTKIIKTGTAAHSRAIGKTA
jgi:hypothetical protein